MVIKTRYTVSDEMLEFCQLDKGTVMFKFNWMCKIGNAISLYIKYYLINNDLYGQYNYKPDEKLIKLLKLEEKDITILSIFGVNKLIKYFEQHYIKVDEVEVKEETVVEEEIDEVEEETDILKIYVIYHIEIENITIFTPNKDKIRYLIESQAKKYDCLETDFKVRELIEETDFDHSFN